MRPEDAFLSKLSRKHRALFLSLTSAEKIQQYLDTLEYCSDSKYHCPLTVMNTGVGCCVQGAFVAAVAFRRMGYLPLMLEMTAVHDDDHVLAVYRKNGCWGAVAKSNYVGLRARLPVYRSLRELIMSYFEVYYNLKGERSLRTYSLPLNLARFDRLNWMTSDKNLDFILEKLEQSRHFPLFTQKMIRSFNRVDRWLYKACMLGTEVSKAYHG
jgi:hypothetical protein